MAKKTSLKKRKIAALKLELTKVEAEPEETVGRPKKKVDEKLLEKLAQRMLNDITLATCLEISVDTLHRHYAEKIALIRANSKAKLADVLLDEAIVRRKEYAVKMMSVKHLGYAEKLVVENSDHDLSNLTDEELDKALWLIGKK